MTTWTPSVNVYNTAPTPVPIKNIVNSFSASLGSWSSRNPTVVTVMIVRFLLRVQPSQGQHNGHIDCKRRYELHELRHSQANDCQHRHAGELAQCSFLQITDETPTHTNQQQHDQGNREDRRQLPIYVTGCNRHMPGS